MGIFPDDGSGAKEGGPTFIDLFAGCGGLSLGLRQAGLRGVFAVERSDDAFETFRANFLLPGSRYQFEWPSWFEPAACPIEDVLDRYGECISDLAGSVDLIAGGPPCQGFSFAGRRNASDPRNRMFKKYVEFVKLVRPKLLLLENVPGMDVAHQSGARTARKTYYDKLIEELDAIGYEAFGKRLDAVDFGVPQRRQRLVVVGVDRDFLGTGPQGFEDASAVVESIFAMAEEEGLSQRSRFGGVPVTAEDALSDLEIGTSRVKNTTEYLGGGSRSGYRQVRYLGPKTAYQQWAHEGAAEMDSMRLAKHSEAVQERFRDILRATKGRRGKNLTWELRADLGMLKHRVVPMDPAAPAPTLTTLPDDILHYREPRILTVREYARLQSFPDWFVFRGKYTTGGPRRRIECPRYTQIGNAVPPLMGRALGVSMTQHLQDYSRYLIGAAEDGFFGVADSSKECAVELT